MIRLTACPVAQHMSPKRDSPIHGCFGVVLALAACMSFMMLLGWTLMFLMPDRALGAFFGACLGLSMAPSVFFNITYAYTFGSRRNYVSRPYADRRRVQRTLQIQIVFGILQISFPCILGVYKYGHPEIRDVQAIAAVVAATAGSLIGYRMNRWWIALKSEHEPEEWN